VYYKNVILTLPSSSLDECDEDIRKYDLISRSTLIRVLEREGCDVVLDPFDKSRYVDFGSINMEDNILLVAWKGSLRMEKRVSLVETWGVACIDSCGLVMLPICRCLIWRGSSCRTSFPSRQMPRRHC
jgi:hypothetical protein